MKRWQTNGSFFRSKATLTPLGCANRTFSGPNPGHLWFIEHSRVINLCTGVHLLVSLEMIVLYAAIFWSLKIWQAEKTPTGNEFRTHDLMIESCLHQPPYVSSNGARTVNQCFGSFRRHHLTWLRPKLHLYVTRDRCWIKWQFFATGNNSQLDVSIEVNNTCCESLSIE